MTTLALDILLTRARFNLLLLLLLLLACIFPACKSNTEWLRTYKTAVIGDWEEVRGTRETMHFSADGSLIMNSPSEHHSCTYEFPDPKHIRLDCVAAQIPHKPETYGFALADDKLMISDSQSTGTYKRTPQDPQP